MRIYIAGPYTKPDPAINVNTAIAVADKVLELGHYPYVPHLTHLWHLVSPKGYETWLAIDREFLRCCDALLRIPGDSVGADLEVSFAKELGIPVFFSLEEIDGH